MKFSIKNHLEELETLAVRLSAFGEREGLSPLIVQQMNLALDELVTNAIEYGYDEDVEGTIEIELDCDEEKFTAVMSDDGRPFDPFESGASEETLSDEASGIGVFLVRQLMDEFSYKREKNRNRIVLLKWLHSEEERKSKK
ncbi:MAG TPA: ATP-binding protein [Opitutales bacterium]|nr:ATP-binding protein [Opitutales bacterium]